MRLLPLAGFGVGATIAGLAMSRALADDHQLRLRTTDNGQFQHVMITGGALAAAELVTAASLAVAHARGWSGIAGAAAGATIGLGVGTIGSVLVTRLLRDPDSDIQREWNS
jgi:hypothetical protein